MYYIGIDIGTSSVKAVLVDINGRVQYIADSRYDNMNPQLGWVEQNPEIWFLHVKKVIARILKKYDKNLIDGIGVTGQMHTTIILNKNGQVIRPAILWNDLRTGEIARKLKEKVAETDDVKYLRHIISTGSPLSNLCWIKENEPENFAKIHKMLITKDYIVYRLTGNIFTDYCDASTSALFDMKTKQWSKTVADLAGIPYEIFPEIRATGEIAGSLTKQAAQELNLNENVKVIVGTGDNPATAVVSNIADDNIPVMSLGSSGVLCVSCPQMILENRAKNILFAVRKDKFINLMQAVVQSAGLSHNWFMEKILQTDNYSLEQKAVERDKLGKNSIIFFPHISGDKLMFADPDIRGAFIGLDRNTRREDMVQAVLEGIAFALKDVFNVVKNMGIDIKKIKVTGGGTKSSLWLRIIADILNIPLEKLATNEGAAYGIALLTVSGCNSDYPLKVLVKNNITIAETVYPDEKADLYEKQYKIYQKIYPALKNIFQK